VTTHTNQKSPRVDAPSISREIASLMSVQGGPWSGARAIDVAPLVRQLLALVFPQHRGAAIVSESDVTSFHAALDDAAARLGVEVASGWSDRVVAAVPEMARMLGLDAKAMLEWDPAATSIDEVVLAYPGLLATAAHRLAHEILRAGVPLLPRLISEHAHSRTGIDIHPGATIGERFVIDHGTGVVIGETSIIGDRVRLYQGVTLGAHAVSKKLAHQKRHPTIGNDVVVYANATILGGTTVIGDGSIIGGNVWMTSSVPPRSVVQFSSRVEQRPTDDGLEFHI
jgi:serine O-acetyltransferase